jgi:hypothetical protein
MKKKENKEKHAILIEIELTVGEACFLGGLTVVWAVCAVLMVLDLIKAV